MPLNAEAEVFRGLGDTGSAVVVRPNAETAVDYFARLQEAKNKVKFDDQSAALRALDSVKPWSADQPYFTQKRKEYIDLVTGAMKGKYTQDPNYIRKVNDMQDQIIADAALSNEHKVIADHALNQWSEHPETYDETAKDELDKYKNTPLHDRPLEFRLKQLDNTDYFHKFQQVKIPMASKGDCEILTKDEPGIGKAGDKVTYSESSYSKAKGWALAQQYGKDTENKDVRGLKKHLAMGEYPDIEPGVPGFRQMSGAEQEKALSTPEMNHAAAVYIDNVMNSSAPSKVSRGHANAPASRRDFNPDGTGSNGKFNVVQEPDGTTRGNIISPTATGGAATPWNIGGGYTFSKVTGQVVPDRQWNSTKSLQYNAQGDLVESKGIDVKGTAAGVYPYIDGKEYVQIDVPKHTEKQGRNTVDVPAKTVFIPYQDQVGAVKAQVQWVHPQYNDPSMQVTGTKKPTAKGKQSYTKAELTQKAKDAGYTYDEYYNLVKDKVTVK